MPEKVLVWHRLESAVLCPQNRHSSGGNFPYIVSVTKPCLGGEVFGDERGFQSLLSHQSLASDEAAKRTARCGGVFCGIGT